MEETKDQETQPQPESMKMPQVERAASYPTVASIPPNTLFRLQKSGTLYFKMADGSIRNVDKKIPKKKRGHVIPKGIRINKGDQQ